jgi:primosomal protein N' (replication factor Y)
VAKETFTQYASVILELSIDKALDYGIPAHFLEKLRPGMRVEVPLRGKLQTGYVLSIKNQPDFTPVKPIQRILSSVELITPDLFELAIWMARYYCAPLRQVFKVMIPSSLRDETSAKEQLYVTRKQTREELSEYCRLTRHKYPAQVQILDVMLKVSKGILLTELLETAQCSRSSVDSLVKKGLLTVSHLQIDRSPLADQEYFKTQPKKFNEEQQTAFNAIAASLNEGKFAVHLIHGVTGSGKTEIYLQAIEKTLKANKSSLMLVPEIALTGQTIERFRSRFDDQIAILHHRLSKGERFDEWHRIHRGEAKIIIGARSAVFSPAANLGLIIVDEEHESSYKQDEESPCYQARDMAVMRGKLTQSTVILGSATPSLESFYNAKAGKYTLSTLQQRAASSSMPDVKIIDMKKEYEKAKGFTNFSEALLLGIKKRQSLGEQTILFLNRRGFHTMLLCQDCGASVRCVQCDLALTFHKGESALRCHLCGYEVSPPPKCCPACKQDRPLKFKGVGTEQIERSLHALFPDIRTLRIDADTTKHKGSHQRLLREFATGKADVLIGTQMIAKGLHFPQVTLVGVLNSDATLNLPDFRASEIAFQLITQVAGRSGRGTMPGEVLIQTCMPENSTILHAAKNHFYDFYEEEIHSRQLFNYPPFTQMVKVGFSGLEEKQVFHFSEHLRQQLAQQLPSTFETNATIPCGYSKIKNRFRFQFLVRGPSVYPINRLLEHLLQSIQSPKDIRISIDVNPSSTYF